MKPFLLFLKIVLILFTPNLQAQSLIKCHNRLAYWAIPEDDFFYIIRLNGDIDLSEQHDILNVNEKALQYVLLGKHSYTQKDNENDDISILLKYTDDESERLLKIYNVPTLEAGREIIVLSSGKSAIFWYFNLPEGKNKKVTMQLFASMIIDQKIFGLGTPLFVGDDFDNARVFLLNALDTVTTVKNPQTLCNE